MDLYEFLPKYPEIDNQLDIYSGNFNQEIYNKKEFREYKLEKVEKRPENKGELMNHQKIISRFFSVNTPYNELLLYHYMGTGKTCAMFGPIEEILSKKVYKRVYILARSKNILEKHMNELANVCTYNKYVPEAKQTSERYKRQLKKIIGIKYTFKTFYSFVKDIKLRSDSYNKKQYENCIFAIDEVHNLRLKPTKKDDRSIDIYKEMHRFLHLIKNKKVLLLSGTPMKDRPEEISNIMNLILPTNQQLPTGKKFLNEYMENGKIKEDKKEELREHFKGRISYLKINLPANLRKIYNGETFPTFTKYLKLCPDYMKSYQSKRYLEIYDNETKNEDDNDNERIVNLYSGSRQASLCVFPKEIIKEKNKNKLNKKVIKKKDKYKLQKDFVNIIKTDTKDTKDILKHIRKYSSKYYNVLKNILDDKKNKDKTFFIYSSYVNNSGLILFSKLLELFKFKKYTSGTNTDKRKRYILLTGNDTSSINKLIKKFNEPQNKNGEYIKIILGSRLVSEGLSFHNIQNVHILTGHWNFSETEQVISRAIRSFSHKDLMRNDNDVIDINIFLHVSIPKLDKEEQLNKSIDLLMYKKSEQKDISIKNIEYFIKKNAFDCELNIDRNRQLEYVDDSRDCDYEPCDYSCNNVDANSSTDYSSYNIYYNNEIQRQMIEKIKDIFNYSFYLKYDDIKNEIEKERFDIPDTSLNFILLETLQYIINTNEYMYNKYGFVNFLREDNNIYFLVNNISHNYNKLSSFYTKYPIMQVKQNFSELLSKEYYKKFDYILKELINTHDKEKLKNVPLNIQLEIIKNCIFAKIWERPENKDFREWILSIYNIKLFNNMYILYFENTLYCLKIDNIPNNIWEICDENVQKMYVEQIESEMNKFKQEYKYYGKYNNKKQFQIVDVSNNTKKESEDSREQSTGKVATSYKVEDLAVICLDLDIEIDLKLLNGSKKTNYLKFLNLSKTRMLDDKNIEKVLKIMKKSKNSVNMTDLKLFKYYCSFKKKDIIEIIKKKMEENGQIIK